jgi:hypothetical protein
MYAYVCVWGGGLENGELCHGVWGVLGAGLSGLCVVLREGKRQTNKQTDAADTADLLHHHHIRTRHQQQEQAQAKFQEISQAFEVLSDAEKRKVRACVRV